MNETQYYQELKNYIEQNFDGVQEVLSEFGSDREPSPEALVITHKAFPETFAQALASRSTAYLGADGQTQKPDKIGKILEGATGLLMAIKGIRDFKKNGANPAPDESPVIVKREEEAPKAKILGMPKGLFALGAITVVLLAIFFGLKYFKK